MIAPAPLQSTPAHRKQEPDADQSRGNEVRSTESARCGADCPITMTGPVTLSENFPCAQHIAEIRNSQTSLFTRIATIENDLLKTQLLALETEAAVRGPNSIEE